MRGFDRLKKHGTTKLFHIPPYAFSSILIAAEQAISIADIIRAVDEQIDITNCKGRMDCHDGQRCQSHDLWSELSDQIYQFLSDIRLGQLMEQSGVAKNDVPEDDSSRNTVSVSAPTA